MAAARTKVRPSENDALEAAGVILDVSHRFELRRDNDSDRDGDAEGTCLPGCVDQLPSASVTLDGVVVPTTTAVHHMLQSPAKSSNAAHTFVTRTAASFHKRALKRNVLKVVEHSHLKLGTLASSEIKLLHTVVHAMVVAVPLLQILYGVVGTSTQGPPSNQADLGDDGVWADGSVQMVVLLTSTLFIRRLVLYTRRQPVQTEILRVAGLSWVIASLSLVSNAWNALHPDDETSRELMGATNTLLAVLIYFTLTHLSDFYLTIVSGWPALEQSELVPTPDNDTSTNGATTTTTAPRRWLQVVRGQQFAKAIPGLILVYMALRLALGWRSAVVFDFLPMTNVITPVRLILQHGKSIEQPHLLADCIVITVFDALLLGIALYKCACARRSFQHVFVQDFARIFTEFHIFVLYFRDTALYATVGGHIAAWSAPFDRLFSPIDLGTDAHAVRVVQMGAVQLQLGFLVCMAVWTLTGMYCALPDDAVGLKGWVVGTNVIKHQRKTIKYFLYESDVYLTTKFPNLRDIALADPSQFIMTAQVEALNLAQLVYACGKHESAFKDAAQELEHVQQFVRDRAFTIVEIIQDEATDTHCLILESLTTIVVAFRGTSSKKNAKTDLQAAMALHLTAKQSDLSKVPALTPRSRRKSVVWLPDASVHTQRTWLHRLLCKRNPPKVHSGFYAAYLSVQKRVLERVKQLYDCDPRKVLATGHSLGGALAALCSFDVVVQLAIANVTCTTFGCPRLGNTSFKKKYNRAVPATFAFVNAGDVVTKLPPKTPKALSYTSVGTVVLLNAFGNLVIDPNVLELALLHRGYSAKAHMLRAYQLSMLLWCLRSHKMQYLPHFWRPPREFLETSYGHLAEIREYLERVPGERDVEAVEASVVVVAATVAE